ncbi:MAG: hypothetical protein HC802_01580 [Caldilineaceae bacterium]|nr:hypothetical protein [Caldilineaceae bacterium]
MTIDIPTPPSDFDAYWSNTMDELAALPVAPELTLSPLRSTDFATLYEVRLTSIGPYRIFAHFSVPHGEGPFPVLYHTPGYGSVVHIPSFEERQQFVAVALRHRGQRLSDQPFAAAYPGLLTSGLGDNAGYIYRGIVADCCRVIDFLLARPEVDAQKIAVVGNELALFTAALRPQVNALYFTPGLFYAAHQFAQRTTAYPHEELNDYLRTYPERESDVQNTLAYFEPTYFAPRVRAATAMMVGGSGDPFAPAALAPLLDAFSVPVETTQTAYSSYLDGVAQAKWLWARYGLGDPVLPRQWQS